MDWLLTLTRNPSWRKGKRAIAMRVWRPIAKKSTANQRYNAISYWRLIITVVVLITVCDILSRIEVKSRNHFCCCILIVDLSGIVFSNINAIAEKYIYWATILSETIRFYLHSFSHCCLPNLRNDAKFRQNSDFAVQDHPRFWCNRGRISH